MLAAQSPTLLHEYSTIYTHLTHGKRELIGFGMERVLLNRFVLDSADSTNTIDPSPVLATVNPAKVTVGETKDERIQYCRAQLVELVGMQEEVNTLQKVAREKGISAGLLTIIGQASVQSPDDNGASVIRQLNQLLNAPGGDAANTPATTTPAKELDVMTVSVPDDTAAAQDAANDANTLDYERMTTLQKITATMLEHKRALMVDMAVCLFASCLAIKLVS